MGDCGFLASFFDVVDSGGVDFLFLVAVWDEVDSFDAFSFLKHNEHKLTPRPPPSPPLLMLLSRFTLLSLPLTLLLTLLTPTGPPHTLHTMCISEIEEEIERETDLLEESEERGEGEGSEER